ncbi:MAG TPA: outer membrane beta-barrel protein [Xanthobacteraceae bacterium]|nr:outer membrane beta-barrel protein [Xanthobacteraceae bacterium]
MKKLVASIAILALATPFAAQAADLPAAPPPAYKTPVVVPLVYSWTGCYIGGNVGGKWVEPVGTVTIPGVAGFPTSYFGFDDTSSSGTFIAGGQIGCNYQAGNVVFGIEGDFDWQHWTDTVGVGPFAPVNFIPGDSFGMTSNWQGSVRGRLGYAWDRTLFYVTGGVAFTNVGLTANWSPALCGPPAGPFVPCPGVTAADSETLIGGTVGGGVEYALTNNLILGLEGRYTFYASQNFNTGSIPITATSPTTFTYSATSTSLKLDTAEVMAKLNWKFDWGSPVVARY